jgi:predicted amidohydrolase
MIIALAQLKPIPGNIQKNIENHLTFIALAASHAADLIVFPELSITGYEPKLANHLAMTADDSRFHVFQQESDSHRIAIAAGFPFRTTNGITVSLALFRPKTQAEIYSKHFLHPDEIPYFISGSNLDTQIINGAKISFAICYELSVKDHILKSFSTGPDVYIASVAKLESGVTVAEEILSRNAMDNSTMVMMCNSIGSQDGGECAGTSTAWNKSGKVMAQLDAVREGILLTDTETIESKILYFN